MSMSDEVGSAGPMVAKLNAAVRENPLAASLIAGGIAWMLLGGSKGFGKAMGMVSMAADRSGSAISDASSKLGNTVAQMGARVGAATSDFVSSAASLVPDTSHLNPNQALDAVTRSRLAISDGVSSATAASREYSDVIQSKFSETMQQQPLLLGAIGLAIGAGLASAFATTQLEGVLMGEHSSVARETMKDFADGVKERAGQVLSEVKSEAGRQGITTEAAKNSVKRAVDKTKTLASAGKDSLKAQI